MKILWYNIHMTIMQKVFNARKKIVSPTKNKTNPFHNSDYVDLNQLLGTVYTPLVNEGLLLSQPIVVENAIPYVSTRITDPESGEFVESKIPLPSNLDAQKIGSAITYFRRYTLSSLLALGAKDDDGNEASGLAKSVGHPDNEFNGSKCQKCGGPIAISKEGKPYCQNKCWTKVSN